MKLKDINKKITDMANKLTDLTVVNSSKKQSNNNYQEILKEQNEFNNMLETEFKCIVTYQNKKKLYVNEEKKQWYYNNNSKKVYSFDDIMNCEIIEDEDTISETKGKGKDKKKVALGKAIVGGAVFGPAGAIIGGNAGKTKKNIKYTTTTNNYCTKLSILLTLRSFDEPTLEIPIISFRTDKKSKLYIDGLQLANKYISIFNLMIENQNK